MWSTTLEGISSDAEREWMLGRSQTDHLVTLYHLSLDRNRFPISNFFEIIGVASPFPIDTASILEQIRRSLAERGFGPTALRADLTPESLRRLETARIQSVRFDVPGGYRLSEFSEPISPAQLVSPGGDTDRISAVTALLHHTDPPTVVNLFDDNQFYIADPTPESIGEVATQISALWGPSNVAML